MSIKIDFFQLESQKMNHTNILKRWYFYWIFKQNNEFKETRLHHSNIHTKQAQFNLKMKSYKLNLCILALKVFEVTTSIIGIQVNDIILTTKRSLISTP